MSVFSCLPALGLDLRNPQISSVFGVLNLVGLCSGSFLQAEKGAGGVTEVRAPFDNL